MRFGIWEIILIVALALIIFGGSKLAGVGKSLGKGIREFKEEVNADDEKKEAVTEEKKKAAETEKKDDTEK